MLQAGCTSIVGKENTMAGRKSKAKKTNKKSIISLLFPKDAKKLTKREQQKRKLIILGIEVVCLLILLAVLFVWSLWSKINTDAGFGGADAGINEDLGDDTLLKLKGYTNIMYTYHFYAADHSSTLQVEKAYDEGFPVFISEFGFMESSGDGAISPTNGNKWKQVLDSRNISYVAWNISNSKGSASIFKYNTTKLDDVSDSNLKVWGIYLKNWYRAKSLNQNEDQEEEIVNAEVGLTIEIESESGYLQCFITTQNHSASRLDYDWSSTNEGILTISKYSTITILSDGKCSIICKHKTTGAIGVLDVEIKDGKLVSFESRHDK